VLYLFTRKLQPQAIEAVFVGIDDESKGYQIYWPTHQKVSIERDIFTDKTKVFEPETIRIEGENATEKEINPSVSNSSTPKPAENPLPSQNQPTTTPTNDTTSSQPPTKVPFPHEQNPPTDNEPNQDQNSTSHRGTRARKEAGFYNENQLQKAGEGTHLTMFVMGLQVWSASSPA